jgi:hypothetical protein
MEWLKPKDFNPEDYEGFIYKIVYKDGTYYIGKKSFWMKDNRKGTTKKSRRLSKWEKYEGSSKLTGDKEIDYKEILFLCRTKIDLTFWETYFLFGYDVLFDVNSLNRNISGKFYAGRITGSKDYNG